MPHSPSSSEALLSIRTSCDRCRSQKLKCIVVKTPNSTACCQRCVRAIVPCVFGRRNRSRRTAPSEGGPKTTRRESPTDIRESVPTTPTDPSYPEAMDEGMNIAEPMMLHGTEAFPFYSNGVSVATDEMLAAKEDTAGDQLQKGLFGYAFQENNTMGGLSLFGYDIPFSGQDRDTSPSLHHEVVHQSSAIDWNSCSNESDPFAGLLPVTKPKAASATLLRFAADLHERLHALEHEPSWQRADARMDEYPIGSVLQLSQKLQNLGMSLQKDKGNDPSSDGGQPQQSSNRAESDSEQQPLTPNSLTRTTSASDTISPPLFDASVSLILLSCYVTLLQICTVVLGHFQDYLLAQPSARARASSTSLHPNSAIRLGDLIPLNQSHDRIHTAIYMLLTSLEQVEDALCLPPQVRCTSALQPPVISDTYTAVGLGGHHPNSEQRDSGAELMHWGLLSTAGGIQDVLSDLGRKVRETKEMLRQHMGL